jgi:hypothetical protein
VPGGGGGSLTSLARGVEGLLRAGWPASFVLVYDEAWALIAALGALVEAATGNRPNLDALAWYVDPKKGDAGFSPHRDRQPPGDTAAATFRADGSPMYATAWLALTDATPDNSCLYVVPRWVECVCECVGGMRVWGGGGRCPYCQHSEHGNLLSAHTTILH